MRRTRGVALLIAALVGGTGARAQDLAATPSATATADCPADTQSLPLEALFGRWELRIDGQPSPSIVELARHPDYAGVRGTITRGGATPSQPASQLAGDIDDEGKLTLDQSDDGHAIHAVWSGSVQPGSCGKVLEGTWRRASEEGGAHFVLRKLPSPSSISTPTNKQ